MIKSKIVLLSALVSCALISGCKEENKTNVSIEFMHSSVEQERQAVISKLIARFEKENPGITVKQVPVEEDAYNTKVITLSRSGSLPEVLETSHDYAKVMDKEQLIDRKAVATVISNVGEGAFYDGVLRIVRTEDGSAWTGVPVSAWIGGIWYRKDVLAKAGLEEPKNWQQLLDVAQKLNDPANKKYGIALPTAESVLTEQSFSQFALSNQANVFNAEGKITLDTPEMMQALTYYRDLAANTMPGSNDIMEVKDAFMNGTAPMAIYSTYILPAVIKEGDPKNVGFVVPTEKNSAVYGMLTSLTITAGQKTEETEAAEKFVTFMEQADNIADWVMMSPGAALPVNKAVVTTATWKDNDVIKALGELPNQLIGELPNIQVFGAVGDKNFTRMGDVTGSGVVSSMVHNVTVGMFVAGFIGSPAMNFIRGTIDGDKFVTETLKLTIPEEKLAVLKTQGSLHKPIVMGIRPEDIHPDAQEENNISAKISVAELTGAEFMLYTTVGGHELVVRAGALNDYHAGENITIHFDMTKCHFFDAETEIAIR
ncbi:extracellular solute-binding protein [Escherichia coli]|nr:extracellular solute-binding protein [Escherichia coli]